SESSDRIASFYKAHGQLIVIQQVLGAIALVPLTAFILSLRPNRWLRPALVVFAAVELVTNVVPLVILAAADRATSLTLVEDLAGRRFGRDRRRSSGWEWPRQARSSDEC